MKRARYRIFIGRFGRSRGWRRRAGVLLLLFLTTIGLCGYIITRPERLARLASALLTDISGAEIDIQSARLDADGAIHLRGITGHVPGSPGVAGKLFDAREILISHDLWALFRGKFAARSIVLVDPTFFITQDDQDRFNYQLLKERRKDYTPDAKPVLAQLPAVSIRGGAIRLGDSDPDGYHERGVLLVSGHLAADPKTTGVYTFRLREDRRDPVEGMSLAGRLDLLRVAFSARLDRLTLDESRRQMLPRRLRQWWDAYKPAGSAPSIVFNYDADPAVGVNVAVDIRDGEITLPLGKREFRLHHVAGGFRFDRGELTINNLTGRLEDLDYQIDGRIAGFSEDTPFKLVVRIDQFRIPQTPRYLLALPDQIQKQFARFTPRGVFKALVVLERTEAGTPIRYDGRVQVSEGQLRYSKYPYPLSKMHGELRFDNDAVELVGLHAQGPAGGKFLIRGRIAPLNDDPGVHLAITGTGVPVDEALLAAMNNKQRAVAAALQFRPAHESLRAQGLVRSATQPADRATAPVVDLGGIIDIEITADRAAGPKQPSLYSAVVRPVDTSLIVKYWPYPMRITAGRAVVHETHVDVEDVAFESPSGAKGVVRGKVTYDSGGGNVRPALDVVSVGMPIDPIFLASIPKPQDLWLRHAGMSGKLDLAGRIFADDKGNVAFKFDVAIAKAMMQPFAGRYKLDQVDVAAVVERTRITLSHMTGRHGKSEFDIKGEAQWLNPSPEINMRIQGKNVELESALWTAVPPDHGGAIAARQYLTSANTQGLTDFSANVTSAPDKPIQWSLEAKPKWLAFDMPGGRLEMKDMTGSLRVEDERVELKALTATLDGASGSATGSIQLGKNRAIDLRFDAQGKGLGKSAGAILPSAVIDTLRAILFEGEYRVTNGRFTTQAAPATQPATTISGRVSLSNTRCNVGAELTEIDGDIDVSCTIKSPQTPPEATLAFNLRRLRAIDRLISPFRANVVAQPDGTWAMTDLRGDIYGGMIVGSGTLDPNDRGRFAVDLTLQDAALSSIVKPRTTTTAGAPGAPGASTTTAPSTTTGRVSANLSLEGLPADPNSRRGRIEMSVRNANMYDLPVTFALMQLSNFSWPSSHAFDRAEARGAIDGDLVKLERIRFESPGLMLDGAGTLRHSTGALDLNMATRDPKGVDIGPLSELLRGVKDELMGIHIGGTLREPLPAMRPLSGVQKSWQEIFGQPAPRPSPLKEHHAPAEGDRKMSGQ